MAKLEKLFFFYRSQLIYSRYKIACVNEPLMFVNTRNVSLAILLDFNRNSPIFSNRHSWQ